MAATGRIKARYFTADGRSGKALDLPPSLFDGVVHEAALYAALKAVRANRRQGTSAAKSRAEVRGGGRKPWRQKGTGRARQGTIRAPHWRGGGVAHPPVPRDWREELPKQLRALARRSALNARAREDGVCVVEAFRLEVPKTREVVGWLRRLEVADRNVLILTAGLRPELHRSARNVPNVAVRPFGEESAYDLLWADAVVIEEAALAAFAGGEAGAAAGAAGDEDA